MDGQKGLVSGCRMDGLKNESENRGSTWSEKNERRKNRGSGSEFKNERRKDIEEVGDKDNKEAREGKKANKGRDQG